MNIVSLLFFSCSVKITPAKWQAKGGDKNEKFRKDIVLYMSKVVFYPNSGDIFDIREVSGTTYYLIDAQKSNAGIDISYLNTRLVRFMIFIGICGNSVTVPECWRFVPDPGAFDHIFTDQELYQKYGMTPDEIAIIESVIKERK